MQDVGENCYELSEEFWPLRSDETVISVESLGKSYLVGHETAYSRGRRSFREAVVQHVTNFGRKALEMAHGRQIIQGDEVELFWALRDVSFDVMRGEVVGIIGRNGAGKSTLLKVLSRITEPTEGRVTIKGRVASLLEVGTGFHPELTGRENIYLNGAILGMSGAEVKAKFDEIVAFAETEKFLDTPVKRYSSGMYVRLAFAVAAHLDPEILVVDEVLAVGDAGFQKKCLGKMGKVSGQDGKTVLLVSHNLAIVQELCSRVILLEGGQLEFFGDPRIAVGKYMAGIESAARSTQDAITHRNRLPGMSPIIRKIETLSRDNLAERHFSQGTPIIISIDYDASYLSVPIAGIGVVIESATGLRVSSMATYFYQEPPFRLPAKAKLSFELSEPRLNPGTYFLSVCVAQHQLALLDMIQSAVSIEVLPADIYGTGFLLSSEDGVVAANGKMTLVENRTTTS
jgi:lipopolysaccharide transport system ATP-binding protein